MDRICSMTEVTGNVLISRKKSTKGFFLNEKFFEFSKFFSQFNGQYCWGAIGKNSLMPEGKQAATVLYLF